MIDFGYRGMGGSRAMPLETLKFCKFLDFQPITFEQNEILSSNMVCKLLTIKVRPCSIMRSKVLVVSELCPLFEIYSSQCL